jgi:hypothetical protein
MSQIIDYGIFTCNKSSDRSEGFTECPHYQINLVKQTKMIANPFSTIIGSQYPNPMSFINHDIGIIFFCQPYDFG